MAFEIIQYIGILFGIFGLISSYVKFLNRKMKFHEFILWSIISICIVIFSFVPEFSVKLSQFVGIQRGTDLLIYSSILVLFYILFRIYMKIDSINQDITKIVRKIALQNERKRY